MILIEAEHLMIAPVFLWIRALSLNTIMLFYDIIDSTG